MDRCRQACNFDRKIVRVAKSRRIDGQHHTIESPFRIDKPHPNGNKCCADRIRTGVHGIGTPVNFGPGFFPFLFGGLLNVTVAVDFVQIVSDKAPDIVAGIEVRRVFCVCVSLLSFGLLLGTAGFVPAVFVTTAVAMRAEPSVRWRTLFLYAVSLSAVCYVVFLVILGIPVAAFG